MIAVLLGAVLYTVSPNALVSSSHQDRNHWEVRLGSDPANAQNLIACSIVEPATHEYDGEYSTLAYVSHDGGETWIGNGDQMHTWDPDCSYGPGGAYFARMSRGTRVKHLSSSMGTLNILRTSDQGRSFRMALSHPFIDRPFFAFAQPGDACPGTLATYAIGGMTKQKKELASTMDAYVVSPGSRTPKLVTTVPAKAGFLGNGPEIYTRDGHVLFAYENGGLADKTWQIRTAVMDRCGTHFSGNYKITDAASDESIFDEAGGVPSLAQDKSLSPFSGRIYAVWPDSAPGSATIMISHSTDDGHTWSAPVVVSDNTFGAGDASRAHLPSIAVNNRGVVGIAWYDNRGAFGGIGAETRFAASLDGGETFLPSTILSQGRTAFRYDTNGKFTLSTSASEPGRRSRSLGGELGYNGRYGFQGGDTAGLAADPNGDFHALWVDNRTGISQLWTTKVGVAANAMRNGDPDLAALNDVSRSVRFFFNNAVYDGSTHSVTVETTIKNAGRKTLSGPFKLRVTDLASAFGDVRVIGAANGIRGKGAVLNLAAPANGLLKSGQIGPPATLRFQIDHFTMRAFHLGSKALTQNIVTFHGLVYAKAQ